MRESYSVTISRRSKIEANYVDFYFFGYFVSSKCSSFSTQELLQELGYISILEMFRMSIGSTTDRNRNTGTPFLSIRNFSKFHATSRVLNLDQKHSCGENLASSGRRHLSYKKKMSHNYIVDALQCIMVLYNSYIIYRN